MRELRVGEGANRRRALMVGVSTGSLFAISGLSGCADLTKVLDQSCPRDPAESGGINWTPDILHPVFYGFQDIERGEAGAPASMRIWYPTYEGVTNGGADTEDVSHPVALGSLPARPTARPVPSRSVLQPPLDRAA